MRNRLGLAVVMMFAVGTSAHADTPACAPAKGKPILTLVLHNASEPKAAITNAIYASGAWTHEIVDAEGKPDPSQNRTGCLAEAMLKVVKSRLAQVSWKTYPDHSKCEEPSSLWTAFIIDGKTVYEDRTCSGKKLDDASHLAVSDIQLAVGDFGAGQHKMH
jgi:hypothetical protein